MTTVTYIFADNTKQVQPVNVTTFFNPDYRNKKGKVVPSHRPVEELFAQTALDLGAISFSLDGENVEQSIKLQKEAHFSKEDKKYTKKEFLKFKRNNSAEYNKERSNLITQLADKLSKRINFNLVKLNTI